MYPSRRRQIFAEMSAVRIITVVSVLLLLGALLFLVLPSEDEGMEASDAALWAVHSSRGPLGEAPGPADVLPRFTCASAISF